MNLEGNVSISEYKNCGNFIFSLRFRMHMFESEIWVSDTYIRMNIHNGFLGSELLYSEGLLAAGCWMHLNVT